MRMICLFFFLRQQMLLRKRSQCPSTNRQLLSAPPSSSSSKIGELLRPRAGQPLPAPSPPYQDPLQPKERVIRSFSHQVFPFAIAIMDYTMHLYSSQHKDTPLQRFSTRTAIKVKEHNDVRLRLHLKPAVDGRMNVFDDFDQSHERCHKRARRRQSQQ